MHKIQLDTISRLSVAAMLLSLSGVGCKPENAPVHHRERPREQQSKPDSTRTAEPTEMSGELSRLERERTSEVDTMTLSTDGLRIVGLHKLPFDPQCFERDMASVANHPPKIIEELRKQYRRNWDNAWIIVAEANSAPEEIDFSEFAHPAPGPHAQAAYLEQILEYDGRRTLAAFFLHFVEPDKPVWYKGQSLELPPPSPAPGGLIGKMQYFSPD